MKKETDINIDALLRDTFLTVVELRQGTTVRHGMELYRHCQRQVELVRERLKDAGFSRESVEHITYAQCALLDETVLSRSGMDDGQAIWMKDPLQSHFFNTLQAGELLYERMKQVLQEPAPASPALNISPRHGTKPVTKCALNPVWRCWPAAARMPFTRTRPCHKSSKKSCASGTRCAVRTSCLTSKANIRLRFECGPLVGDWSQIDLSRLPLYLNAGSPVACALHRALTLGTQQFWLRLPGQDRRTLDAHFSPLGFEDNDRLWPKGESAFSGYQLLLEYFTFREKFMFVALNGLELVAWPEGITGFEIDVVLNENWPHDLPFDSDNIRLHCVPVINLFPLEADPLHLSPLENEFLLRPMRIQDGHTEIYSVDNIISSRHTGSQAYVPFSSFRHRGGMLRHDAPERYYHTRVKRGPSGLHDTWLILGGDAFDADRMLEDETLSLSLTGTNGHLPRKALQSTLLDRPVHASQNVLRVRNLCAPTQPCYPPARDRFHWRVLSHLGSNFLSMMDNAEILRGTLALYDWTESEMNRRRLEAIVDVQHSLIQRFERGFLLRGVDIQVTLDSNGFAGEGDITLFGELLHRFFALYADIHLFTQLTLILQPTGKCLQWTEHHSQRVPG